MTPLMNVLTSRFPLAVIVLTITALGITGNFFSWSVPLIVVQLSAVALSIWARRTFQRDTFRVVADPVAETVIREGPYAWIRHPMYAAMLLLIWSGVVTHASAATVAIGIALSAVIAARIAAEETLLRARFPDYRDYARSTKTVVPFIL